MGLDEGLQPDLERAFDEGHQALAGMEHREEEDEVGPGGPQVRELDLLDDELLGQDRDRDRGTNGAQVVHGATEPMRLAQHGDRGRTAGLVGAGAGDDVVVRRRDLAGGRRRPLDLGDQVETRRGQAGKDRARWRRRLGDCQMVVE